MHIEAHRHRHRHVRTDSRAHPAQQCRVGADISGAQNSAVQRQVDRVLGLRCEIGHDFANDRVEIGLGNGAAGRCGGAAQEMPVPVGSHAQKGMRRAHFSRRLRITICSRCSLDPFAAAELRQPDRNRIEAVALMLESGDRQPCSAAHVRIHPARRP